MNIPAPLLDRMEVIRLSGYTEDEKIAIAKQYLLPKQVKANGLKADELHVAESALRDIVRYYTREAGVRNLERDISKICRKVVKGLLLRQSEGKARKAKSPVEVTAKNLDKYLGVRRFTYGIAEKKNQVGQVTGLAWTEVGGDLLTIEAVALPGKGKTTTTGKLGEVMNESIAAALSVVRHRSKALGIQPDFYQKTDLHIHLPEGATPKDGPSAGGAIVTAIVSILTGIPVRADVAMTGEITLRGEVLPIGGLKEKLLAAGRGGIKTVLIPEENVKDLAEIPDEIKNRLDIRPVRWIEHVLEAALERQPTPLPDARAADAARGAAARTARSGREARRHQALSDRATRIVEGARRAGNAAAHGIAVARFDMTKGERREQVRIDRRHCEACRHLEGGRGTGARCHGERHQRLAQERRNRDAGGIRLVLRRQPRRAAGTQSAHRRCHQDPRRESAEVPGWQSPQGCCKLMGLFTLRSAVTFARPTRQGCLAQLVERRPYKANVGGSIPSAPTSVEGATGRHVAHAGVVVQLVRIPACHAGGRGFESRPLRQIP